MPNKNSCFARFTLLLLVTLALSNFHQRVDAAETMKPFFVVAPRAKKIQQSKFQGKDQLFYSVEAEYPAAGVLKVINTRLSKSGWKALDQDWLNPELQSSHIGGWFYYKDQVTTPATSVRGWQADWTNREGDILTYILEYRCPEDLCSSTEGLKDLKVIAIYTPAQLARRIRQSIQSIPKK